MMVRSPNSNTACPYRWFLTGHGTGLPNPVSGQFNQRQSMIEAGATAPCNNRPGAPTAQTVIVKPLLRSAKPIGRHPNPHRLFKPKHRA